MAALGAYQTFSDVGDAATWVVLVQLAVVLAGSGVVVVSRLSHVEASGEGLRIVKPPFVDQIIAWHDIAEVRREPPTASMAS